MWDNSNIKLVGPLWPVEAWHQQCALKVPQPAAAAAVCFWKEPKYPMEIIREIDGDVEVCMFSYVIN